MGSPTSIRSSVMDPLLTFKFVVSWDVDGQRLPVAGVSKIGPLARTTEKASAGNEPSPVFPGQTKYDEIQLERGLILDVAFERWANKVFYYQQSGALGRGVSLADLRKTLIIDLTNQAGQILNRFYVFNSWPSKFTILHELEAAGDAVALESMTLQNEGWQRDSTFTPVPYPSYSEPSSPVGGAPPG